MATTKPKKPPKARRREKTPWRGVVLEIEGVTAEMPVRDLTVHQFVEMLMQVSAQLRSLARPNARRAAAAVVELMQQTDMSGSKADLRVKKAVKAQQLKVLATLPSAIDRASRLAASSKSKSRKAK